MTWILWIGALLVVCGAGALVKGRAMGARGLWLLAATAFVAVLIWSFTVPARSLVLVVTVVSAIVATLVLVAVTAPRNERQHTTEDAE